MRDPYSVLQVAPKASDAEIKSAFRSVAKTCHPDVRPGDRQAEQTFHEARQAYLLPQQPRDPAGCTTITWRASAPPSGRGGAGRCGPCRPASCSRWRRLPSRPCGGRATCPSATSSARRRPRAGARRLIRDRAGAAAVKRSDAGECGRVADWRRGATARRPIDRYRQPAADPSTAASSEAPCSQPRRSEHVRVRRALVTTAEQSRQHGVVMPDAPACSAPLAPTSRRLVAAVSCPGPWYAARA